MLICRICAGADWRQMHDGTSREAVRHCNTPSAANHPGDLHRTHPEHCRDLAGDDKLRLLGQDHGELQDLTSSSQVRLRRCAATPPPDTSGWVVTVGSATRIPPRQVRPTVATPLVGGDASQSCHTMESRPRNMTRSLSHAGHPFLIELDPLPLRSGCTLNPQPSTLNPQPSTLNPQPSTLNPQPSALSPKP